MIKSKTVLLAGIGLAVISLSGLVLAGVPKGKESITLDQVKGKKGEVVFSHAKHASEYKAGGKAISCKTCHHTGDAPKAKACSTCHVAEGGKAGTHGGKTAPFVAAKKGDKFDVKSVVFHKLCLECHKKEKTADKPLAKCTNCHKK